MVDHFIAERTDHSTVLCSAYSLYPRRHFFEQIAGALSTCEHRSEIPIFTDKHRTANCNINGQLLFEFPLKCRNNGELSLKTMFFLLKNDDSF